jgi:hypothetical protein
LPGLQRKPEESKLADKSEIKDFKVQAPIALFGGSPVNIGAVFSAYQNDRGLLSMSGYLDGSEKNIE